jgi:hypothetical protein
MDLIVRSQIFEAILREREFQDKKYGPVLEPTYSLEGGEKVVDGQVQGPGGHELAAWTLIVEKELDEAKDAAIHGGHQKPSGRNGIRAELIQVAAVCVAALEQHGVTE